MYAPAPGDSLAASDAVAVAVKPAGLNRGLSRIDGMRIVFKVVRQNYCAPPVPSVAAGPSWVACCRQTAQAI
jgi:hypothetical protein